MAESGAERNAAAEEKLFRLSEEFLEDAIVRRSEPPVFGLLRCGSVHTSCDAPNSDDGSGSTTQTSSPSAGKMAGRDLVAGWLLLYTGESMLSKAALQASSFLKKESGLAWKHRFVVLEDGALRFFKTETKGQGGIKDAELVIQVANIKTIEACASSATTSSQGSLGTAQYSLQVGFLNEGSTQVKLGVVKLKPLEGGDFETVARWVALLLYHTKKYDKALDARARMLDHGFSVLQDRFRRQREATKVEKMTQAAISAIGNHLSAIWNLGSSIRAESVSPKKSTGENNVDAQSGPLPSPSSNLGETHNVHLFQKLTPTLLPMQNARPTPFAQEAHRWVQPLPPDQEEDEVWENERWNIASISKDNSIVRGWCHSALFSQERQPFSDRVGNPVAKTQEALYELPCPEGWEVTLPFTIDMSGLAHARCDAKGWSYEAQFSALDARQARGSQRGKAGARWVVRRRRWYRRRARVPDTPDDKVTKVPSWIAAHGWLGMRGTLFWRSRYCMLVSRMTISPDDSPEQIEAERQRRPGGITAGFFAYFTDKFCARLLGTNLGAIDWTTVREDDIRIKPLDSSCTYSDDVASLDFPGQFHLGLSGEKPLRLLNASDVESRMLWTTALAHVIQSSLPRAETIHEIIKDTSPTSSLRNSIGNGVFERPSILRKLSSRRASGANSFIDDEDTQDDSNSLPSENVAILAQSHAPGSCTETNEVESKNLIKHDEETKVKKMAQESAQSRDDTLSKNPLAKLEVEPQNQQTSTDLKTLAAPSKEEAEVAETTDPPIPFHAEPLENIMLDITLDGLRVDEAFHLLFLDDTFSDKTYSADKFFDVKRSEWTHGVQPGSERSVTYMMPRNGPVPQNQASLRYTLVQARPGTGYQLDQSIRNPGVPYGKVFNTLLRFVLIASADGESTSLKLSHEVEFVQRTVMKAFIRAGGSREVRNVFQNRWKPALDEFLHDRKNPSAHTPQIAKKSDSTKVAPFVSPPLLNSIVIDTQLPCSVDRLYEVLFKTCEFDDKRMADLGAMDVVSEPWTNGPMCVGSTRELRYVLPRMGPIAKNTIQVSNKIEQVVPGQGYQVDQRARNPEVPFGKSFVNVLRFTLSANSDNTSRLVLSHTAEIKQGLLMRAIIRAASLHGINTVFINDWLPALIEFLARPVEQQGSPKEATDVPTQSSVDELPVDELTKKVLPENRNSLVPGGLSNPIANWRAELDYTTALSMAVLLLGFFVAHLYIQVWRLQAMIETLSSGSQISF